VGENAELKIPLGDMNRHIWSLRRKTFLTPIKAITTCPYCKAQLEFEMSNDFDLPKRESGDVVYVQYEDFEYKVRMPRITDFNGAILNTKALCPTAPWHKPEFVTQAETALESADNGLRMQIQMSCDECQKTYLQSFDTTPYFWLEIEQAAKQLILEVIHLSRSLGWSETDILAMSRNRRRMYLVELGEEQ